MSVPVSDVSEDQVVPPAAQVPDRADAPVSEVTERFLRAVVAEVPLALIEELHLFSPLRQGTVETGIAVLAARKAAPVVEEQLELAEEQQTALAVDTEAVDEEAVTPEAGGAEATDAEPAVESAVESAVEDAVETPTTAASDLEASAVEASDDPAAAVSPRLLSAQRHTVFTARYRYVIKGPERGKWEASLKAEADAPLITVETVVRGVQRRAGEESEIVRYTAAQIARALRLPLAS